MSDNIMPKAWNEPGSGGKKDNPWGDKNKKNDDNSDGPPDLDQIFKKLKDQIRKLFGIKSTGGDGFSKKQSELGIVIVAVVALVAYFVFGFYTVSSYEQAVVTRFGKYSYTVNPGLHWAPPLVDAVQRVNTENIKSSRSSGWMLTKDENIVSVEMEVQYRVIDAEKYLFNVAAPDATLTQAADSALRKVIGDSFTDDVLTDKKQQIAEAIKDQLIETLTIYDAGFHIEAVNFRDSRPPDEVKDAFDDVTKSREDKERLKLQAEAYANTVIPEVEGQAKKIQFEAEAYKERVLLDAIGETQRFNLILPGYQQSPQVTKTRMYLDAMEEVLTKSTKIIVNSNSGNNLIYLPLDKLMDRNKPSDTTFVVPQKLEPAPPAISNDPKQGK
jgi:membrane protease subunit HflK